MPVNKGPVRSWSHYESTVIITWLMTTRVRWWDKLVVIDGRITVWDQVLVMVVITRMITVVSRIPSCGYSWCCARIMGKDQAPCGHLMITTVLFIPSLIWSWDDRVMSEVGKWCICWLRGNHSRLDGAWSVIMLHASIVGLICSCCDSCIVFMSVMPCYIVLMISW